MWVNSKPSPRRSNRLAGRPIPPVIDAACAANTEATPISHSDRIANFMTGFTD